MEEAQLPAPLPDDDSLVIERVLAILREGAPAGCLLCTLDLLDDED